MERKITDHLKNVDFVDFAVLFGSFALGRGFAHSDLDLGIALRRDVTLHEFGCLITELEKTTKRSIDLVVIDDLPSRNPVLAFVVAQGKLLFARDTMRFVAFQERTFLQFLDTQFLREMVNQALLERIRNDHFGKKHPF